MKTNFLSGRSDFKGFKLARAGGLLLAGAMLAGCPAENQKNEAPVAANSGKVVIRGSNTIGEELAPRLIADFKKDHAAADFDVQPKATGYGLAALRSGQCDIAAASRLATKEEQTEAEMLGVQLNEYTIGSYSVAVIVNPKNAVADLSKKQVKEIFTGSITNWKDVGGADAAIHIYARDPISGTYLGFQELAMDNKPYALGPKLETNYIAMTDAIAQDENGIGYCGAILPKGATVKAVSIGGVAPSAESVNTGKYPYTRGLHLYTLKGKESSGAHDFVEYVLSSRGQGILSETGFVPHP
jgi:phosphate transport system substrate-binding protein